jgi:hypothetical protein
VKDDGILERNLLALSGNDPALGIRVSRAEPSRAVALEISRTGQPVPTRSAGSRRLAYHSLVDPEREARRFSEAASGAGYVVFLGLGGGYQLRPFVAGSSTSRLLVLEPDLEFVRAVMGGVDLSTVLLDRRVRLWVDPDPESIGEVLLADYLPAVHGDLRTVPLRPSVDANPEYFRRAAGRIHEVIGAVADDYTVQAKFGQRWFVNTLANLPAAERATGVIAPVKRAIITGAGPSLERQLERLPELRRDGLLIASDTSLPALLSSGIRPDLVISIDCQQISYHHFLQGIPPDVPLVLDLASPAVLTRLTPQVLFFSSGHPFSGYVNRRWRKFPILDTSGGNVSHAAVSLARHLGAREIFLLGIDFSYPEGKAYSRGTYLYPLFRSWEGRLRPLETLFLSFIFKNTAIDRDRVGNSIRYSTRPLIGYKERLEQSLRETPARIVQLPGPGVPLELPAGKPAAPPTGHGESHPDNIRGMFAAGPPQTGWRVFLGSYGDDLRALPAPRSPVGAYFLELDDRERLLWTTLLPAAAALRERYPELRSDASRLLREVIEWSVGAVTRALDR